MTANEPRREQRDARVDPPEPDPGGDLVTLEPDLRQTEQVRIDDVDENRGDELRVPALPRRGAAQRNRERDQQHAHQRHGDAPLQFGAGAGERYADQGNVHLATPDEPRVDLVVTAGICTTDLRNATDFKRRSQAGMVMVNLPTAGVDYHVPFGGTRGSSYGPREQGFAAVEFYTQIKTVYTGD